MLKLLLEVSGTKTVSLTKLGQAWYCCFHVNKHICLFLFDLIVHPSPTFPFPNVVEIFKMYLNYLSECI